MQIEIGFTNGKDFPVKTKENVFLFSLREDKVKELIEKEGEEFFLSTFSNGKEFLACFYAIQEKVIRTLKENAMNPAYVEKLEKKRKEKKEWEDLLSSPEIDLI